MRTKVRIVARVSHSSTSLRSPTSCWAAPDYLVRCCRECSKVWLINKSNVDLFEIKLRVTQWRCCYDEVW